MYPLNLLIMFAAITKGAESFYCNPACENMPLYLKDVPKFMQGVTCNSTGCSLGSFEIVSCNNTNISNQPWFKGEPEGACEEKYEANCPHSPGADHRYTRQIIGALDEMNGFAMIAQDSGFPNSSFNKWVLKRLGEIRIAVEDSYCCQDPSSNCSDTMDYIDQRAGAVMESIDKELFCDTLGDISGWGQRFSVTLMQNMSGLQQFRQNCMDIETEEYNVFVQLPNQLRALFCGLKDNPYGFPIDNPYAIVENTEPLSLQEIVDGIRIQFEIGQTQIVYDGHGDPWYLFWFDDSRPEGLESYNNTRNVGAKKGLWCSIQNDTPNIPQNSPQGWSNWSLWGSISGATLIVGAGATFCLIKKSNCCKNQEPASGRMLAQRFRDTQ